MMTRYITRTELNGALLRIEGKQDTMIREIADLRTDVKLICQQVDGRDDELADCVEKVNNLESWRVTARRIWIALAALIATAGTVIGILIGVGVIHI